MGFEINTRMKFSSVSEKFRSIYGVELALSFEKSWGIGEHRLSELSPKTNGVVRVTDEMTVGMFKKQMAEQFGGSAAIWVIRHQYKGHVLRWFMEVKDEVKMSQARFAEDGKFIKAEEFLSFDSKSEQEVQNELAHENLEDLEKKALTFSTEYTELEKTIRESVKEYELFDVESYIRELKESMSKAAPERIEQITTKISHGDFFTESVICEVGVCCSVNPSLNKEQLLQNLSAKAIEVIRDDMKGKVEIPSSMTKEVDLCCIVNPSLDRNAIMQELSDMVAKKKKQKKIEEMAIMVGSIIVISVLSWILNHYHLL